MTDSLTVAKGQEITLTADSLAFEGKAIAHIDSFVVFIEGALPGDTVRARVFKKKKQFAEARALEILSPSPYRTPPECPHFGPCGGCRMQDLQYEKQLEWKRQHVIDAFERIGNFENLTVHDTLPSTQTFYYRNKMEFSFGETRWLLPEELGTSERDEPFALGLHIPKRYDRILSIEDCRLQSPQSTAILNATRTFFLEKGERAYSTATREGNLRHLVIREGKNTGDRMVFLVTFEEKPELIKEYATLLRQKEFGVTTFVHGVTTSKSTVAVAEREIIHFGPGNIEETLGDNRFTISPTSFFQTNPVQAKNLYDIALRYADLQPSDILWDFYCGTGTISIYASQHVSSVLGVELNEAAIENARVNASLNGIENTEFICSDILAFVNAPERHERPAPGVIILDPPRPGLHPSVVEAVGKSGVERCVYISCNPATCARDCATLSEMGYTIEEITPVDMFPHTYHIECVVKLRKTK